MFSYGYGRELGWGRFRVFFISGGFGFEGIFFGYLRGLIVCRVGGRRRFRG